MFPWRTNTILPSCEASGVTAGPALTTYGARMKTVRSGSAPISGTSSAASNESTCRPKALRATTTSSSPSVGCPPRSSVPAAISRASRINPAHVP